MGIDNIEVLHMNDEKTEPDETVVPPNEGVQVAPDEAPPVEGTTYQDGGISDPENDDLAPDADEDGDTEPDPELEALATKQPKKDQVDGPSEVVDE